MNILIVSFSVGGAMGDLFMETTKSLSKSQNVSVLTNMRYKASDLGTENVCNINFDKKDLFTFLNPESYLRIIKFLKKTKFDVALIYSPHVLNFFVCSLIRKRKICTFIHDHKLHSGVKGFINLMLNSLVKYSYSRSKTLFVCYNKMKEEMTADVPKGTNIVVNYFPILHVLCNEEKSASYNIDVLFYGRIETYKGLDILIDAAKSCSNVNFHIAGRGDLDKIYGIKKLPSNVTHHNRYVPDEELADMIRSTKMVVLPYRDATGSQTAQCAHYYAKPVIATNTGCFPEYVLDGKSGIIVDPENSEQLSNAIIYLMKNEKKREEMGCNGKERLMELFTDEAMVDRYVETFNKMIKS